MISLKEYLQVDPGKHKYDLPIPFWKNIWYLIVKAFLKNTPISDKLYVDEDRIQKYYWRIILNYIESKYSAKVSFHDLLFKSRMLQTEVNIRSTVEENEKEVVRRGHGNSDNDIDLAISKAIGELLERYHTSVLSDSEKKSIVKKSWKEICEQVKTVRDFHDFSPEQKDNLPYLNINDTDMFECIPVKDIFSSKEVYYPVRANFWYNFSPEEKKIADLTTSGSAGGFTLEDATLSAFYEAIERDSFFCHWLTSTKPEKIVLKEGEIVEYDKMKKFYEEIGYELYILKTETDLGVPSSLCLLKDVKTGGICISGGAGISYRSAISKAINEMRSCSKIFEFVGADLPEGYLPFISKGIRRMERLGLAKTGKHFDRISFLLEGEAVLIDGLTDLSKVIGSRTELGFLQEKLKNIGRGYENIYLYVSDSDSLLDLGYSVVRVIIPKLYQLYLTEDLTLTKSERVDDFYLWKTGEENWEINTYPHPFP